jgi:predicted amidohydrolase
MYVAGAGMTGVGYCGRSVIVDPLGVVQAGLGEAEGVTVAEITKQRLAQARARLPLVAQRRAGSPVKA